MTTSELRSLVVLIVISHVSACGLNMEKNYRKMRPNLVAHNYAAVDAYLDSVKEDFYGEDNRLLFYMDKGMVLHLDRRYKDSNGYLEKAKKTAEDLWTESVSAHAAAWLTTDNSLPYQGEDFEKVLIHFVAALNYLNMGDYSAARVEARQVTEKLELYNSKYEGAKNAYADDAFCRWLAGKMASTEGGQEGLNDAWIDYRKALAVYEKDYAQRYQTPIPGFLVADALRALRDLGADFETEFSQVSKRFASLQVISPDVASQRGEVVLIHMSGDAPYKVDRFWDVQANGDWIRIAYPEFVRKPYRIVGARLEIAGSNSRSELAEDVAAIAVENLSDHMGRIKAKAIARQVAKYVASKGAQAAGKKMGGEAGAALQVAGALFSAGSSIAEEADKRSWITLPAAVTVGSVFAPPGDHKLRIDYLDRSGKVVTSREHAVTVQPGKTTFITTRTFE